MNHDTEDKLPDPNSKSQRKRDMTALQQIGEELTNLPVAVVEKCELPEFLYDAVMAYKALPNKHGARRRQLQFIGKLMRDVEDETLDQINDQIFQNVTLAKRRFQLLETLRDNLLDGNKEDLATYISANPDADIQLLNQLIRQAKKEREQNAPPTAARRLFQLLREQAQAQ